jgi:uncharacterized membrane protein YjjB (DUF3815 family)
MNWNEALVKTLTLILASVNSIHRRTYIIMMFLGMTGIVLGMMMALLVSLYARVGDIEVRTRATHQIVVEEVLR